MYVYTHTYICMCVCVYIYSLHLQLPGYSSENPWNFLRNNSNGVSFITIFGILSSVPKILLKP